MEQYKLFADTSEILIFFVNRVPQMLLQNASMQKTKCFE